MKRIGTGIILGGPVANPNADLAKQYEEFKKKTNFASAIGGVLGGLITGGNPIGVGLGTTLGNLLGQIRAKRDIGTSVSPMSSILYGLTAGGLGTIMPGKYPGYLSAILSPLLLDLYGIESLRRNENAL